MLHKIQILSELFSVDIFLSIKLSACLLDIATLENSNLESFLTKLSDTFEKMRRIEGRVANDQDLKLSDCLRYHMRDTNAAKDLLYRRLRYTTY